MRCKGAHLCAGCPAKLHRGKLTGKHSSPGNVWACLVPIPDDYEVDGNIPLQQDGNRYLCSWTQPPSGPVTRDFLDKKCPNKLVGKLQPHVFQNSDSQLILCCSAMFQNTSFFAPRKPIQRTKTGSRIQPSGAPAVDTRSIRIENEILLADTHNIRKENEILLTENAKLVKQLEEIKKDLHDQRKKYEQEHKKNLQIRKSIETHLKRYTGNPAERLKAAGRYIKRHVDQKASLADAQTKKNRNAVLDLVKKHGEDWQNVLIAAFEDTKKLKEERRRLQTALNSAVAMRDKHKSTGEELKACAHRLENDRERLKVKMKDLEAEVAGMSDAVLEISSKYDEAEAAHMAALEEQAAWSSDLDWSEDDHQPRPGESVESWKARQTMRTKQRYRDDLIVDMNELIQKFQLRGDKIRDLMHHTVALLFDKDIAEVKKQIPLPAPSTTAEHIKIVSRMQHRQLENAVRQDGSDFDLFTFEVDEGQIAKRKRFVTNINITKDPERLPVRFSSGARPLATTGAEHECEAMLETVKEYGWDIVKAIGMTSDSASTMEKARELFEERRKSVFNDLEAEGSMQHPSFLPETIRKEFYVRVIDGKESTELFPAAFYRNPDLPHMGRNGEKTMTEGCLGGGICIADGQYKGDLLKAALFRFARLVAKDDEFFLLIKQEAQRLGLKDVRAVFAKIPGEINHRLKIVTTLSIVYTDYRLAILSALEKFNTAYGKGQWKGDRGAILDHAREVFWELHDPRILLWSRVMAKLHPIGEFLYAVFQEEDGFIMHRVGSEIEVVLAKLQSHLDSFAVDFDEDMIAVSLLCHSEDDDEGSMMKEAQDRLKDLTKKWLTSDDSDRRRRATERAKAKAAKAHQHCRILADGEPDEVGDDDGGLVVDDDGSDDDERPTNADVDSEDDEEAHHPSDVVAPKSGDSSGCDSGKGDDVPSSSSQQDSGDHEGEEGSNSTAPAPPTRTVPSSSSQQNTGDQCEGGSSTMAPPGSGAVLLLEAGPVALQQAADELKQKAKRAGVDPRYLVVHEDLQNGGNPHRTTVPEVKSRHVPIHFVADPTDMAEKFEALLEVCGGGRYRPVTPKFVSSLQDLLAESLEACRHGIQEYRRYILEHSDWYTTRFPSRLASYWDVQHGLTNLKRDMHLVGKCTGTNGGCSLCEHKIPVWTPEQILKEHAWALGFFDNPAHQEELSALLQKSSVALAHCGAAGDEQCRQPRGGVSLGRELDKFFDRFLAPYSVNQMSTERALSKLKFSIGKVGVINEETVNFRLYKDNDLKNKLDVAWLKEARADFNAARQAKRLKKANQGIYDDQGILKNFDERLQQALEQLRLTEQAKLRKEREAEEARLAEARRKDASENRKWFKTKKPALNVVKNMAKRNGMIIENGRAGSLGDAQQPNGNGIDRAARGVLERWLCRNVPPEEIEELAKAAEGELGPDSAAASAPTRTAQSTVQKAINKLKAPQLKRLCRILGLEHVRQVVFEMKSAIKAYAVDKDESEMLGNVELAHMEPPPAPAPPAPPQPSTQPAPPQPSTQPAPPQPPTQQPATPSTLDPQLQAFLLEAARNPALFQQVLQLQQQASERPNEQSLQEPYS